MTLPPEPSERDEPNRPASHSSHLKPLRIGGNILAYAVMGAVVAGEGLFLLTTLSVSPWLFLLYPVLIGVLLVSLSVIVLHLLHRFP